MNRASEFLFFQGGAAAQGGVWPPAAAGVGVVTLMDSIGDNGDTFSASGLTLDSRQRSETHWANTLLGQRIRHQTWQDGTNRKGANQSIAGAEPGDAAVTAAVTAILATDVEIVIVALGTNGSTAVTAATHIAALSTIVNRLLAGRKRVVLGKVRPRLIVADPLDGYAAGDVRWIRMYAVNAWVEAQRGRAGVYIWENFEPLRRTSGASEFGEAAADVTIDDVHLRPRGAYLTGVTLAQTLAQIVPSGTWLNDVATGNHYPNPTMTGSGALSQTGATGFIATSQSISRISGTQATVVGSKDVDGAQLFTFSSTTGGANTRDIFYMIHTPTTALSSVLALPADAWLQFGIEIEVSAWHGFSHVAPWIYASDSSINYRGLITTDETEGGLSAAYSGIVVSSPIKRAVVTQFRSRVSIGVYSGNHPVTTAPISGTGTIKVKKVWLFETANPETRFPL